MSVEFPSGPVPLNSPFYIDRPPIEELAYGELLKPGSVTRIKAPRKMGKSSLLLRILARATTEGYRTATLDFQQADETIFSSLNRFLRWFCSNIARQLNLKPLLDDYWDEDMGSKVSCTLYLEGYLLEQINSPVVLALNEINLLFEHPKIAREFLPLLRFWHEQAKQVEALQKLRLIVVHSTEIYVPLNINQSPFNVGLPIKIPQFTLKQVQDLAKRHQIDWTMGNKAQQLMAMVGGHPYLIRLALYYLDRQGMTLEKLLREAPTEGGIYSDHLRGHQTIIQQETKLADALRKVVTSQETVQLASLLAYKLDSMGLVRLEASECSPSCQLYRQYFAQKNLGLEDEEKTRIDRLEAENRTLKYLSTIDGLTQIANRACFDNVLQREWQLLASQAAPLSLILCDIDCFKAYNDTYGHQNGDKCLQRVAVAIAQTLKHSDQLAARYGGEEFAAILPRVDARSAVEIAEEIRGKIRELAIAHVNSQLNLDIVTASFGVATMVPSYEDDPAILIRAADEALYESKNWGRDRVTLHSTLNYRFKNNEL